MFYVFRRDLMARSLGSSFLVALAAILIAGCSSSAQQPASSPAPTPTKNVADKFSYPLGDGKKLTQAKDRKDDWYNALDFGANGHLGEDWNKNSGGNTDCGEAVYAVANGKIIYAEDAGPGWGNVVIITHTLPDGTEIQSLYGHLQEILKTSGVVKIREQIGKVGNANGRYFCHLHLEIRKPDAKDWNQVGGGYLTMRTGWLDPSDFLDNQLSKP